MVDKVAAMEDARERPTERQVPRVQSVARAIRILNEIASSSHGLTAQEISRAVDLNRATTYHLLQTLTATGYVVPSSGHRYRIGLGLSGLVAAFERQVLPGGLAPLARELAARTGETAYVTGRQGDELVLLCSVPGYHPVGVANSPLGPIREGHARASGKLLLAFAPEDVRSAYLDAHPLAPMTPKTITSRSRLLDEFERIREAGYALDEEEYALGVCCVAAPLAGGIATIAVALSAPHDRYIAHRDEYVQATLQSAAAPHIAERS
jgi:IclR family acetate operon transcriptional repressor